MAGRVPEPELIHLALSVANFDAQVRWYKEALGLHEDVAERLDIAQPRIRVALLRADNGLCIELIERDGSSRTTEYGDPIEALNDQGYHHWALRVADLEEALARLEAAGAREIGPRQQYGEPHNVSISFITDPEGNMIELVQPLLVGPTARQGT